MGNYQGGSRSLIIFSYTIGEGTSDGNIIRTSYMNMDVSIPLDTLGHISCTRRVMAR
jgi:hypothetical protein